MIIVIDCCLKFFDQDGIGRYTTNLVESLEVNFMTGVDYHIINKGDEKIWRFLNPFRSLRKTLFIIYQYVLLPIKLRRYKCDIYHSVNISGPIYKISNYQQITTIHDVAHKIVPESQRYIWRRYYDFILKSACRHMDKIICVSNTTKKDLNKYYNRSKNVFVTYLGVDSIFKEGKNESKVTTDNSILFVGTIEPRKNLDVLINAYINLPLTIRTKFKLKIVGRAGWLSECTIRKIEQHKDIIWIKNASDSELVMAYKKCAFFVMPSLYEGFGLPIFEAISFGKNVLVSDIPIFRELLGTSVTYFEKNDVESLTTQLLYMIKSNNNLSSSNTPGIKDRFNWFDCARKTYEVAYAN